MYGCYPTKEDTSLRDMIVSVNGIGLRGNTGLATLHVGHMRFRYFGERVHYFFHVWFWRLRHLFLFYHIVQQL